MIKGKQLQHYLDSWDDSEGNEVRKGYSAECQISTGCLLSRSMHLYASFKDERSHKDRYTTRLKISLVALAIEFSFL